MDKYLNKEELRLQSLLMSKDFGVLNAEEQQFVLQYLSKEDYELERLILSEAPLALAEETAIKPALLVMPSPSRSGAIRFTIPLYQAVIGVAVTVAIMLALLSQEELVVVNPTLYEGMAIKTDTVERIIVQYDTIVKTVEKPIYIESTQYVEATPMNTTRPDRRLLEVQPNIIIPAITKQNTANQGQSMKDDGLSDLITTFE